MTLVDRRNHHLFQPLLYQVATGMLSPGQIAPPLRHVLRRVPRTSPSSSSRSTGFDLERRVVHANREPGGEHVELSYDTLIVAAGAGQSYFGHDEFALLRARHEDDRRRAWSCGAASSARSSSPRRPPTTRGTAGMAHHRRRRRRSHRSRARGADPRAGRPEPARVSSRRSIRRPCGWCSSTAARSHSRPSAIGLGAAAVRQLEDLGVELRMNARVTHVDGRGVDVETKGGTERIVARTVVWAAGVQASPLAAMLADATGAQTDRAGRIAVLPDLTLPGHPEVFAVGDMVTLQGPPRRRGGRHAGRPARREHDQTPPPRRRRDPCRIATGISGPWPRSDGSARCAASAGFASAGSLRGSSGCSSTSPS